MTIGPVMRTGAQFGPGIRTEVIGGLHAEFQAIAVQLGQIEGLRRVVSNAGRAAGQRIGHQIAVAA
jgi:hypothetical protein